jgi:hypothetical protein
VKRRPIGPVAAVLVIVLASCSSEPPAYESKYVPTPTSTIAPATSSARPMTPGLQSMASFVDDFDRPDTELGLGEGWDMRGVTPRGYPISTATDGFIRGGRYTYDGTSGVYAARQLRGTVRGIGTVGRFRTTGDGDAGETSLGMGISANDELTADAIVFSANRSGWQLRLLRAHVFQPVVMQDQFAEKLELNTDYRFEFEVAGDNITVQVPGSVVSRNAPTPGLLGDRSFWLEYVKKPPADKVFDFDSVWAVEDGQPLFPVGG